MKALRTEKLIIEMYKPGGEQWIHLNGAEVEITGDDVVSSGTRKYVHRQATDENGTPNMAVITKVVTVTDPVTGQTITASVAGLKELIRKVAIDWYGEDFGTVHDTQINKAVFL